MYVFTITAAVNLLALGAVLVSAAVGGRVGVCLPDWRGWLRDSPACRADGTDQGTVTLAITGCGADCVTDAAQERVRCTIGVGCGMRSHKLARMWTCSMRVMTKQLWSMFMLLLLRIPKPSPEKEKSIKTNCGISSQK